MSARFEVVEAKAWHCGAMARLLRKEHAIVIERAGLNAHRELRACFDQSAFRRVWLIDGRLAALGGVIGTSMNASGMVWLALSQEATRHPIAIVKEARRQLDTLMLTKQEVMTTVVFGDEAARRLAIFLGFHVEHDGMGAPAQSRQSRRMMSQFVEKHEERIVDIGKVRAALMGYHRIEA
jgi:hypothetical protein